MALIDRIAGFTDSPIPEGFKRIPVDAFWACLYELSQGKLTKAQIVSYFELDAAEDAELQWLIDKYNAQPTATAKQKFVELIRVMFMLAEGEVPGYTTNAQITARINSI